MTYPMGDKFLYPIKSEFLLTGAIPEDGQTYAALSQCLITDEQLRNNREFIIACMQVSPDLLQFADKKIQREIKAPKIESVPLVTFKKKKHKNTSLDIPEQVKHLKIPSPSVMRKVKEIATEVAHIKRFKESSHTVEKSS